MIRFHQLVDTSIQTHRMQNHTAIILSVAVQALLTASSLAHPGSGIVVDSRGNVFVGDIGRGLLMFTPDGKVTAVLREAGHWLAEDAGKKFVEMDFQKSDHWPRWFKHRNPPGSDLALISDGGSPLVVHRDGNLYYVCGDERMIPAGLQIARLSPDGKLSLVAPALKARARELGGLKGLASGPDGALYAVTPGAVLKVNLDGTFNVMKQSIVVSDCDRYLPPNTPVEHQPFLSGLAVNSRGDLYLAATGCRCVLKLDREGQVSTILKAESPWSPTGLALRGDDLYVAEWTNAHSEEHDFRPRVRKVGRDGKVTWVGEFPK
jgi:sugar lactone lactonase YvrE